jgi:hypothetical protein
MNYIYRIYTDKTIGFFSSKDDALSLLYHIPKSRIEVFNNLTPIGIYHLENNNLYFNKKPVILEGFMQDWFQNKQDQSELQVFIPMSPNNDNINKKLSLDELAQKIKQLEIEANNNNEKLEEVKEVMDEKEEKFNEKKEEFDNEKRKHEKNKEAWNQLKNKLEADKRVYYIIKEQLQSGELTEDSIPVLFQDKYPIFKHMDDNNMMVENDTISTEEIGNYLNVAPDYITNNVNEHQFNDLFSSSDPLYLKKDTESSIN